MSHHFVTVCVVCVLCTAHIPCSAHTDFSTIGQMPSKASNSKDLSGSNEELQLSWQLIKSNKEVQKDTRRINLNSLSAHKRGVGKFFYALDINNSKKTPLTLVPVAKQEKYFMKKMFDAYGDGISMTMEGFERILRKLGLLRLLTDMSRLEDQTIITSHEGKQLVEYLLYQETMSHFLSKYEYAKTILYFSNFLTNLVSQVEVTIWVNGLILIGYI